MNLGIVLAALKEYDKSEECYRTSLFHRKNCPDCYYNLGLLVMQKIINSIDFISFHFISSYKCFINLSSLWSVRSIQKLLMHGIKLFNETQCIDEHGRIRFDYWTIWVIDNKKKLNYSGTD